jgi:hypothetical protein
MTLYVDFFFGTGDWNLLCSTTSAMPQSFCFQFVFQIVLLFGLASDCDPSTSLAAEITCVYHNTWLVFRVLLTLAWVVLKLQPSYLCLLSRKDYRSMAPV